VQKKFDGNFSEKEQFLPVAKSISAVLILRYIQKGWMAAN
jgi:hypothetical protein